MTATQFLWGTRVTVANILNHARLVAEGWTCIRLTNIESKKKLALQKLRSR